MFFHVFDVCMQDYDLQAVKPQNYYFCNIYVGVSAISALRTLQDFRRLWKTLDVSKGQRKETTKKDKFSTYGAVGGVGGGDDPS